MVAKGFKGNYFTLQAITATTSYILISSKNRSYKDYVLKILRFKKEDENFSEDPPPIIELFLNSISFLSLKTDKPCYCNIFFACLAHKILKLSRIKKPPICKCRKTKTGISPPLI